MAILYCHNIEKYTDKSHKINYMGLGDTLHKNKAKIKKYNIEDTFRPRQKPGTTEYHKYTRFLSNTINKHGHRAPKKCNIDSDKQTKVINNQYKNKR